MARRKPLVLRLVEARNNHKRAEQDGRWRSLRQAQRDEERRWLTAAREAERQERAAEQEEKRRQREAEAAERRRTREAERASARAEEQKRRAVAREVKRIEQELDRRTSEANRHREREAVKRRQREADRRSAQVEATVAELERLLVSRPRDLPSRRRQVEDVFDRTGGSAVADLVAQILESAAPNKFPQCCLVGYAPEARELLIRYELPGRDVVPAALGYRYVKARDEIEPVPRKETELKALYRRVLARTVLRAMAGVFDATPPALVASVVINGYVAAKDRSTGRPVEPVLISVNATREVFDDLVLDEPELDPVLCLQHLNAIVSAHPYDLEPVPPVVQFDLARFKIVDGMDVVAGLDGRPNLLEMHPTKFENLIRELFTAVGMTAFVTQASRDDGIDAVATNEDPVVGGLCVIQAKRYRNVVSLESVHALAGAMNDKAATKGVLVTTSWFGKASRDFVARNGRIELIDGRQLKALLLEHVGLDVLIGLEKLPRGWNRRDIT